MDVGRREDVHHLIQHILHKLHGLFVAGTKHVVRHAPAAPHLVGTAGTAQPRIGGQGRLHVARQVDLRDNVHMALSGILHKVAELFLSIEPAVPDGVIKSAVATDDGAVTIGANLSQLRVFLDLDAPALVFRQMEMELVHVMQCQHIDVNLHRVDVHEMEAGIEVHDTVSKTRIISNTTGWQCHFFKSHTNRQAFPNSLDAIKQACFISAFHNDLIGIHYDFISFSLLEILGHQIKHDGIAWLLATRAPAFIRKLDDFRLKA